MQTRDPAHRGATSPPRLRRYIREPRARTQSPAPSKTTPRALLSTLRPLQWTKNLTCFAGLFFSGKLFVAHRAADAALGFGCFCFASSAIYLFNDIVDREKDRLNPRTAGRPIASGALTVANAFLALAVLAALGVLGALHLGPSCVLVVAAYFTLNVAYSLRLKHVAIADVMCIALGFVLRVLFGVYAVGVLPTPWIVLCMFFLAMFLGFAKRKAELARFADEWARVRPVLGQYGEEYLNMLLTMSAGSAVLAYALFTVTAHKNPTLVITVVPVVYCVNRYLLQVILHGQGASPDRLLLSDRRLWLGMSVWLLAYLAITYGNVQLFSVTGEVPSP